MERGNITPSSGVIGITSISKNSSENLETISIQRSGVARAYHIPSVILVCEDKLSKTVIELISVDLKGSFQVLTAGTWKNLATMLYGMHFYQTHLAATSGERLLEVVCVTDGDIPAGRIEQIIRETHRGDHLSAEAQRTLDHIRESLVHFNLTACCDESIIGHPEYNHKKWLEEISSDDLDSFFHDKISKLTDLKKISRDPITTSAIELEILEIKNKINETLNLISQSKALKYERSKGKLNYHQFYKKLRKRYVGDTPRTYSLNNIEYSILNIVKTFNPTRWNEYIYSVKVAMSSAWDRQQEKFKHDRFNSIEIS